MCAVAINASHWPSMPPSTDNAAVSVIVMVMSGHCRAAPTELGTLYNATVAGWQWGSRMTFTFLFLSEYLIHCDLLVDLL